MSIKLHHSYDVNFSYIYVQYANLSNDIDNRIVQGSRNLHILFFNTQYLLHKEHLVIHSFVGYIKQHYGTINHEQ